jgi:hypothetical protein
MPSFFRIGLLLIAFATTLTVSWAAPITVGTEETDLSYFEYSEIHEISEAILGNYPPSKFMIVGIGRSPTPFIAYFQAIHPGTAVNLPLSSFRFVPKYAHFNTKDEKTLKSHFDRYLPSLSELNGRQVVVLDFTLSGESLLSARHYIQRYYKAVGSEKEVLAVGIAPVSDEAPEYRLNSIKQMAKKFGHSLQVYPILENSVLATSLMEEHYDKFSRHSRWYFGDRLNPVQSPLFDQLVETMKVKYSETSRADRCLGKIMRVLSGPKFRTIR